MKLPDFIESSHPLVSPLLDWRDEQLVSSYQTCPNEGKFFVAIFCRYAALTYSLLTNKAPSQIQVDYIFARVWRNLFFELRTLAPEQMHGSNPNNQGLQAWIFNKTALSIHADAIPSIEEIPYSMEIAPLPYWCYLQIALDRISPLSRLLLVLSQTFRWPHSKIISFLSSEGEIMTAKDLDSALNQAKTELADAIPEDVQDIYHIGKVGELL